MRFLTMFSCLLLIGTIYTEEELSEEEKKALKGLVECGEKWDISEEDFKKLDELLKDPTEKILCFMKCTAEKDGTLDEAGNVKKENIDKIIALMKLKDDDKKSIRKCMENLPQVKTCSDFKNVMKCIPSVS